MLMDKSLMVLNKMSQKKICLSTDLFLGGRWVSNPRPSESQSDALTN